MAGPSDVVRARAMLFHYPSNNLRVLVHNRYDWMNEFIRPDDRGVEGRGRWSEPPVHPRPGIPAHRFSDDEWLDVKQVDALHTPFGDASFDFVIASNMIHHLAHPLWFFGRCGDSETRRPTDRAGRAQHDLLPAGAADSAPRRLRHNVSVFDENAICTDPDDLWAATTIVDLLLEDEARLAQAVPYFRMIHHRPCEFLTFLNSGGVTAKTGYLPLPMPVMRVVDAFDRKRAATLPGIFALQVQLVFEKV